MISVSMFCVYKDMSPFRNPTTQDIKNKKEIFHQRSKKIASRLEYKHVPKFPLDWKTFVSVRNVLTEISKEEPMLCMVFQINQGNCIVISDGDMSTVYNSREEAYHDIFEINNNNAIVVHKSII